MFRVSTNNKTPETASSENSESLTVISSVDGVKIIRNLDIAIEVLKNNNIKSAEPVTYDDNGNVIPLSQRFNAESNDIRFSITKQLDKEYADAVSKGDTEKASDMLIHSEGFKN